MRQLQELVHVYPMLEDGSVIDVRKATGTSIVGRVCTKNNPSGPEVIKLFFMLNSAEHEIFPAHKC